MADRVIGEIFITSDYDKFKKLQGNRDVRGTRKIINSIDKVGYVLSPILVNEKYEVIDGQNRLEALKAKALSVPYIIQEGTGLKECRALNIGQTNWNTIQFVNSYAISGNENYVRLYNLLNDFQKQLALEGVMLMTFVDKIPQAGGANYNFIKEGKANLPEAEYERVRRKITDAIAKGYKDFKDRFEMTCRSFWGAVSYAYQHEEIDEGRLITKMLENPKDIIPCSKITDQLRYFEDAYNRNLPATKRVFMSSDFQRRKYIEKC